MKFYQLKIELQGLNVWRRVVVPEDITFYELKQVVDASFGWSSYHEYELAIKENLVFVDRAEEKILAIHAYHMSIKKVVHRMFLIM